MIVGCICKDREFTRNKRYTLGCLLATGTLTLIVVHRRLACSMKINPNTANVYSEYPIQQEDSICASSCLYILDLTRKKGFRNAVLNLYYQEQKG